MQDVRNEFTRREKEVNRYFDFLKQIKDNNIKVQINESGLQNIDNQLFPTLRANAILLLYNLLESTIILTIDHIHLTISTQDELKYEDASVELKKIWIEYKYDNFKGTDKNSKQILEDLQQLENEVINIFEEGNDRKYLRKIKGVSFSGKIDKRQVEKFADKYGFPKNKRIEGSRLVRIKNQRNALAHGELSFNECGNQHAYQDILKFKKETLLFLKEFLNHIENYINNKKYRHTQTPS